MTTFTRLMMPFNSGNIEFPAQAPVAIFGAQSHGYSEFPRGNLHCIQGFFPIHAALKAAGYTTSLTPPDSARLAILHVTRSRDETRAWFSRAYHSLESDGQLVVDGSKTDGIESLLKSVRKLHPVDGQLSKAHGKVFWLRKHGPSNPFANWAELLNPAKNRDGFLTAAGMFSADGIDPGSAELVPVLSGKLKGRVADLGAGWGWLAIQALKLNPDITGLDLIEAHSGALECAGLNVNDTRATLEWADACKPSLPATYDRIITNPPFHAGRRADPVLGRNFIHAARMMLKPTGEVYLVANRQLAYETTLNETFSRWKILHQTGRYKIIHARKPK